MVVWSANQGKPAGDTLIKEKIMEYLKNNSWLVITIIVLIAAYTMASN